MILKIKEFAKISSGNTPLRSNINDFYMNGVIPWVKTMDLNNGKITKTNEKITLKAAGKCKPYKRGTVLVAMYGGFNQIGRTGILDIEASINQAISAIEVNKSLCDPEYLIQYLNKKVSLWRKFAASSRKDPNITSKDVGDFDVYLPPLPEQRAIADILSTWDTAIEKMEKLIEAKEKRFRGLLNNLLNNPEKDWQKKSLGNIGEISSAGVDKKINKNEKPVRLVNYLDVYRTDHIYSRDLSHEVTTPETKAIKCRVKRGDIFFTPTSEVNYDIANSAVAMEDIPDAVYSYHVVRLRLKEEWDLNFKAYAFKSNYFYKQAYQYCEGSGQRYVISQKSFRKINVFVPPIEKQKHIGQILFKAQNEIKILKNIKYKHKKQKCGLMQKLLTGEWRVKV